MAIMKKGVWLVSLFLLATSSALAYGGEDFSRPAAMSVGPVYWTSVLPKTVMPKAITDITEVDSVTQVKSGNWVANYTTFYLAKYGKHYERGTHPPKPHLSPLSIFFFEKQLQPGNKMYMDFTSSLQKNGPHFLPRHVSSSIPFSSSHLPQILSLFSLNPDSKEAKAINETILGCERAPLRGESIFCPTSLESIADYVASEVGKDAVAFSTVSQRKVMGAQHYRIMNGAVATRSTDKVLVCHKQEFPYAVFFCHRLVQTKAYVLPLLGRDGTKAKAVVICHHDTSQWDPAHLALLTLKIKPGTAYSVCHVLPPRSFACAPKE